MIEISIARLTGSDRAPEAALKDHDAPTVKLVERLLDEINQRQELQSWTATGAPASDTITVEAVLHDNDQLIGLWSTEEGEFCCHAITAGLFEEVDGDYVSKKHRVIINAGIEPFSEFVAKQIADEGHPASREHLYHYLAGYLARITHEVVHAVEFIKHGNAKSPWEIQNDFEAGRSILSPHDVSTGNGILWPHTETGRYNQHIQKMENRVDLTARNWLADMDFPEDHAEAAINLCADNLGLA